MEQTDDCRLFRQLIYDRSDRKVEKHRLFMNRHERTCLACVDWMFLEVADMERQHVSEEHALDGEDLARLCRAKEKLKRRRSEILASAASDIGEIEPTDEDLAEVEEEEQERVAEPKPLMDPVRTEEDDDKACSA